MNKEGRREVAKAPRGLSVISLCHGRLTSLGEMKRVEDGMVEQKGALELSPAAPLIGFLGIPLLGLSRV